MKQKLLLMLLVIVILGTSLQAQGKYLNVSLRTQEHSQWCWAGSSQCVLYYKGTTPTQCALANYSWSRSDCCGNTNFNWNHSCNQPQSMYGTSGSLGGILTHWGVSNTGYAYSFNWNSCKNSTNANRLFVIRWGYSSGGGHFVVGYGYWTSGGTNYIGYMNPWPGEGYTWESHSYLTYNSSRSWTHTLQTY